MLGIVVETYRGDRGSMRGYVRRLDGLTRAARDMHVVFEDVHKQFLATERGIFASGGVGSQRWAPLTAKYARYKAAHGQDPRVMRATGELARALTTGRGPGAVTEISRDEATFGTNLQRAVYAHRGEGRRRRRLITIDRRRRSKWVATVRQHLWDAVEAGGTP